MVFIFVYLFAELAANHRFISFFSEKTKTSCLSVGCCPGERNVIYFFIYKACIPCDFYCTLPVDIKILPELQVIYVSEQGRETDLLTDTD